MGKGGQNQTVTSVPDAGTQAYVDQIRKLALGYAGIGGSGSTGGGYGAGALGWLNDPRAGDGSLIGDAFAKMKAQYLAQNPYQGTTPPPLPAGIQQAIGQYGQYANAGQQGLAALTGNAGAQQQFMSPYLGQLNPFFAQQRQQAVEGANQQATLAGAFGGDRSQIGAAVAGNQADQTQAGFNYQAFQDAMNRAQYASTVGLGAIGAGAFLPQQYASGQLGLLQQGLGPYGQTQTQQMHSDPWSQLLGLGLTAGGLFLGGPPGAAAASSIYGQGAGVAPMFG